MQFDRAKLEAVILYTCQKCPPSRLGAVKLHKVLYFFDMLRFAESGTPATGATYRKRPHGPTCDQLLPTLRELERSSAISIEQVDYHGFRKNEYTAVVKPEMERLNEAEVSLLDDVVDFVCFQNSARTISEFSHQRPWESVEFGAEIPYESAFLLFPTDVSHEAFDRIERGLSDSEATRPRGDALGSGTLAAFRSRVLSSLGKH